MTIDALESRRVLAGSELNLPDNVLSIATSFQEVFTNQFGDATINSRIDPATEKEAFAIFANQLNAGFSLRADAAVGSTLDLEMAAYSDQNGDQVVSDDDTNGLGPAIGFAIADAIEVWILVGERQENDIGDYTFQVAGPDVVSTALPFGAGVIRANGNISGQVDYDFFDFLAPTAGSYVIEVRPSGGLDATFNLYDAEGTPVLGTFLQPIDSSFGTERRTIDLAAGERYFLRVDGFDQTTGDFELVVAPTSLVVTTLDTSTNPNDGNLSLVEAISAANAINDVTQITFSPALTASGPATISLNTGQLAITESVSIIGPGANLLTIDAGDNSRHFRINDDSNRLIDVTLANLTLTGGNNQGTEGGGAILSTENVTILNSVISGNTTTGVNFGGGIFHNAGLMTIRNSTISGNTSYSGGAIINYPGTGMVIENTTISGNRETGYSGGAIFNQAPLTIRNSTITNNISDHSAGIFSRYIDSSQLVIQNSIIAGNRAPDDTPSDLRGTIPTITHSLVGSNNLSGLTPAPTADTNGNLIGSATPIDPLLGPLQNNGGSIPSIALLPSSPTINAGDPGIAANSAEFDGRDTPFARVAGGRIDMGAYETQSLAPEQLVVTTLADEIDFGNDTLSLREAISLANGSVGTDIITFDRNLAPTPRAISLTLGELAITTSMIIDGSNTDRLTISAGHGLDGIAATGDGFRIFHIDDLDPDSTINITIRGLGIAFGDVNPSDSFGRGGAIRNTENLLLDTVTVAQNHAFDGGGIDNATPNARLSIVNSVLFGNSARQNGNSGGFGGGIFNADRATLLIANSTIGNNSAQIRGGAIASFGSVSVTSSTISANTVTTSGTHSSGGILSLGLLSPSLSINNTIVSGNFVGEVPGNVDAPDATGDFNLLGSGDTTNGSNIIPSDEPGLDILRQNEGPTLTFALLPTSPAVDAGSDALAVNSDGSALVTDQRGPSFLRFSDNVDIGAYELQKLPLDYGDAPDRYPVTLPQNGARHSVGSLFLGTAVTVETDGVPSADADSDTDDDGVFLVTSLISASVNTASSFSVVASEPGKLDAWIDFNNNGDWSDAGEQIFASVDVVAGENLLSFTIPAGATSGSTGARFRLSTAGGLAPTGAAADGEVEDYLAAIVTGSADTLLEIDVPSVPSGNASLVVEGTDLVVRKNDVVLFRAPFESFGELNLNGSPLDDILQLTILEALATRTLVFDGGLGRDFLELVEAGRTLDLTNASVTIREIEGIDIRGTGNNTLVISIDSVKAASSTTDTLEVISNVGDTITFGPGWRADLPRFIDGAFTHVISEAATAGTARVEVRNDRFFTNPLNRFDVDRNGAVQPLDALRIINAIRRLGSGPILLPTNDSEIGNLYFDVSGDNNLTALDALRVINAISRINRGLEPEGESALVDLDAFANTNRDSHEVIDMAISEFEVPAFVSSFGSVQTTQPNVSSIDDWMEERGSEDVESPTDLVSEWEGKLSSAI